MKVVLFEGPDKVGKTTLLNNIVDKMAFGETDEFGPKHKPLVLGRAFGTHPLYGDEEQNKLRSFRLGLEAESIAEMLDLINDEYVLFIDRFHLSEAVYGTVFNRGYDRVQVDNIDALLENSLLVYVRPSSPDAVFNRFKDLTDRIDGLTLEEYTKSVELFDDAFGLSRINDKQKFILDCETDWKYSSECVEVAVIDYIGR